jgi:hypothetical protein
LPTVASRRRRAGSSDDVTPAGYRRRRTGRPAGDDQLEDAAAMIGRSCVAEAAFGMPTP